MFNNTQKDEEIDIVINSSKTPRYDLITGKILKNLPQKALSNQHT